MNGPFQQSYFGTLIASTNILPSVGITRSTNASATGEWVDPASVSTAIPLGVSKNFVKYNGQPWNTSLYIATAGQAVPYWGPGEEALVIPDSTLALTYSDLAGAVLCFTTGGKVVKKTPANSGTLYWSCLLPIDLIGSADITAYSLIRARVVQPFCFTA